jgi:hypothetical protein
VGDRNKITIKDIIKICAKHAHVKKIQKKRKYGLVARYSVRNENNNLEDAWLICEDKETGPHCNFRESVVFYGPGFVQWLKLLFLTGPTE